MKFSVSVITLAYQSSKPFKCSVVMVIHISFSVMYKS